MSVIQQQQQDHQEWTKAAMTNDSLVAEFLTNLANNPPRHHPKRALQWSVRQPRSNKSGPVKPPPTRHRASPTTPLSLSAGGGATSFSGGFEESSEMNKAGKLATGTRSKVIDASEKTAVKKSRKKKTLAQLKEEENSLVKERRGLKREITAMRVKLEKERATNESLKRRKLEQLPHSSVPASVHEEGSGSGHPVEGNATSQASNARFVVPDLNMPFEDSR